MDKDSKSFDLEFRKQLLETLRFTVDFLNKNNLRYCSGYGTMLGAIRHKGLIPWDDDIDLLMPRKDYEKLVSMSEDLQKTDFYLLEPGHNKGFYCPFAKIVRKNTTIWEFKKYKYTIGVYVDIFPIDTYDDNLSDAELLKIHHKYYSSFIDCQKSYQQYSIKDYIDNIKKHEFVAILKHIYFLLFYRLRREDVYKRFIMNKSLEEKEGFGERCICLADPICIILKREWFDDLFDSPFEDITLKVPRMYDEYLTLQYNDYLTPPPIEERCCPHKHYYANLRESLSLKQIEERISMGETRVF